MTIRTGKSGRYRYYACSTSARYGKTACTGLSIPMEKIDRLVMDELQRNVFTPTRLRAIVSKLADRSISGREAIQADLRKARKKAGDAADALGRLYQAIETGIADLSDPLFKERVDALRLRRDETAGAVKALEKRLTASPLELTTEKLTAFTDAVKERFRNGDPAFRRAYLRMFVDRVELHDDEVRISGPTGTLLQALGTQGDFTAPMVPSCVRKWRPRRDSNTQHPA